MEDKVQDLESLVHHLQAELNELKDGSIQQKCEDLYKELQEKEEKINGNLGVDKVVLTDVGEKIQVVVETPLGSVVVPVNHTPNTSKPKATDSSLENVKTTSHVFPAMKGAVMAGMTPEQIQDFKKQNLQINTLQQKVKELETRLAESNSEIKRGNDVTTDLQDKEAVDVKEIYLYLDEINTTMSEKIANQRVEMEKLAGDTPQPINYDPFNYGEAYDGDIVDFAARKRIVELKLLLQGLQIAMNQMKDSVHVSPSINLGYKVVRLDELLEATGFGPAIKSGELDHENGLLISQAQNNEPPEPRYPIHESFQTDEDKQSTWSMTDSIMQTMYRLEVEVGQLQSMVGTLDVANHVKDLEDLVSSVKQHKTTELDEAAIKPIVEKEVKALAGTLKNSFVDEASYDTRAGSGPSSVDNILSDVLTSVKKLKIRVRHLETQPLPKADSAATKSHKLQHTCLMCDNKVESPVYKYHEPPIPKLPPFSPYTSPRLETFYKQPVKLRTQLQRVYRNENPSPEHDVYRMPRPCGKGYATRWPRLDPAHEKSHRLIEKIPHLLEPVTKELLVKGKDGHWYRGEDAAS